jgi:hypothetical protein
MHQETISPNLEEYHLLRLKQHLLEHVNALNVEVKSASMLI